MLSGHLIVIKIDSGVADAVAEAYFGREFENSVSLWEGAQCCFLRCSFLAQVRSLKLLRFCTPPPFPPPSCSTPGQKHLSLFRVFLVAMDLRGPNVGPPLEIIILLWASVSSGILYFHEYVQKSGKVEDYPWLNQLVICFLFVPQVRNFWPSSFF